MSSSFKSRKEVDLVWPIIDGIARKAWENIPASNNEQRCEVHHAAGQLYNKLLTACRDLPATQAIENGSAPRGTRADDEQWSGFFRQELVDMTSREHIQSVTDAYLKSTSLLKKLKQSYGHQRFLFRGQRDISWEVISRKGRALKQADWTPPEDFSNVLSEELDSLADFQAQWESLGDVDILDKCKELPDNHPAWLFRMQHYDEGEGTRLLDVTTSLNAALLFACIDWKTGEVDSAQDGVIYMWPEGDQGNVDDFLLKEHPATVDKLFVQDHELYRYILNPEHNERSKAQSGGFIWWPKFWEPYPHKQPYYLRVVADAKEDIVRDLLSMGFGPKEAVRGIKGLKNEQVLRRQLGLPEWNPIALS